MEDYQSNKSEFLKEINLKLTSLTASNSSMGILIYHLKGLKLICCNLISLQLIEILVFSQNAGMVNF